MKNAFCAIILLFSVWNSPGVDTLKAARQLVDGRFSGWSYGANPAEKQIDCTQFVVAVLEECGLTLNSEQKKAVNISDTIPDLAKAVRDEDDKTRGVQRAVADLMMKGTKVGLDDAKAGDFVQYWLFTKDGTPVGHCALINRIVATPGGGRSAELYGAHKTPAPKGTLGVATTPPLRLVGGADRKIYIVRLN